MTLIQHQKFTPKIRPADFIEAYRDFFIEASKKDRPVSHLNRGGIKHVQKKPIDELFFDARWCYLTSPGSLLGRWADASPWQADIEVESTSGAKDYCVVASYSAIDMYVVSLPAPAAIVHIARLQDEFGKIQQYASNRIVQLVTQIPTTNFVSLPVEIPWVEEAIELGAQNQEEKSLDVIFDNIDEMLLASKFVDCGSILGFMPIDRLTNAQLITVLTATLPAREQLGAVRAKFFETVTSALSERGTDAESILVGLK